MFGFSRRLSAVCLALLASVPLSGHAAWVETRVKAHTAHVDVDAKGGADVSHEILLGVRGGPLRSFEIQGIDADAVLAEGAIAVPVVRFGTPTPIPLVLQKQDDGTLSIEIQRERGLFTGSYELRFAYRTDLLTRDRIRRRGPSAEVEWVGPRFSDGIDVAKVVFRVPSGSSAPTLDTSTDGEGASVGSAYLSSTRHVGDKEELEIVRPHVARGEPAVWRLLADPKIFSAFRHTPAAPDAQKGAARTVSLESPGEQFGWALAALLVALAYGSAIAAKWSLFARDVRRFGLAPRSLLRLPAPVRAALGGTALASAAVLGALGDHPTVASVLLLAALALAAILPPRMIPAPRGPGRWLALTDDEAFRRRRTSLSARFLDIGDVRGFFVFLLLLSGFVVGAALVSSRSSYSALAVLLGSLSLVPIFATGRRANLPVDRVHGAQPFLARLARSLRARSGIRAVPWARIPEGLQDPDELRLLLRVPQLLEGVLAIEIGVEQQASLGGFVAQPFVLVRVREDSPVERALAPSLCWQRGRQADERVAITKAPLPAVALSENVVLEVLRLLSDSTPAKQRTPSRRTREHESLRARIGIASPAHSA